MKIKEETYRKICIFIILFTASFYLAKPLTQPALPDVYALGHMPLVYEGLIISAILAFLFFVLTVVMFKIPEIKYLIEYRLAATLSVTLGMFIGSAKYILETFL